MNNLREDQTVEDELFTLATKGAVLIKEHWGEWIVYLIFFASSLKQRSVTRTFSSGAHFTFSDD